MRTCRGLPRSERAAEGAILGALVGVITGAMIGGMVFATDREKFVKPAILVGLGIFTAATVGNAIAEALPPEC